MISLLKPQRIERFGEAKLAAAYLSPGLGAHDRVMAEFPWEAPLGFYLLSNGVSADGQSPESVLLHNKQPGHHASTARKVKDWRRLEIFSAHMID
jgi:hypothetical protein